MKQSARCISADGGRRLELTGAWTLEGLRDELVALRAQLQAVPPDASWSLAGVERLDSFGALLLWRCWGRRWPERLELPQALKPAFERVASQSARELPPAPQFSSLDAVRALGSASLGFVAHLRDFIALLGQLGLDLLYLLTRPRDWPLREISANLYKAGACAMPIAALVGFLIGIVLSYLSALQLRTFGADLFIVNILGLGIIRELGPVLVAVLVAGRSGSAMTAQLGVMRVTEEIDALATMGISRTQRLILPKVIALSLAMPLLVLWTSTVALVGGMLSAHLQLDIDYAFFLETLPRVVPVANLYIGLVKGVAFGLIVALVACHFGLRVQPNTESLSAHTTAAVVSAITAVILVDAVFAVATRGIGLPR